MPTSTRAIIVLVVTLVCGCAASRVSEVEMRQLDAAMRIHDGMAVADVGAGDGEWSEALAHRVGPSGHVFATEIDPDDVETIRRRIENAGLGNVTTILGDATSTGLPDDCCDAILMRQVYHHLTDPQAILTDLRRALRPGGELVILEITPQSGWGRLEGVPERDGHGISPDDLIAEITAMPSGWTMDSRVDDWAGESDRFCVVFR
jgi:ubiquinone/menaquinone biosynthesis C-methylase UbiE